MNFKNKRMPSSLAEAMNIAEFFEADREDTLEFDIGLRMSLDRGDIQEVFDYARFN